MDSNQYRSGTPKKCQTEDVCYADKQLNPDMDFENVGLNSRNGLPTKASGKKNTRARDEYCLSKDLQNKLVVPVKKVDQPQLFSDDESLDVTNRSKNGSTKKRKSDDWLDNEKHNNTLSVQGDMQCGEESNVGRFRKEKKFRALNTEEKSVTEDDDILCRKGGMKRVLLSDSRNQMAAGTEVKSVNKVHHPWKPRKNGASYQALDCFNPLGKDLGSQQLSLAANSSSSKVSGSHKAKTNLEDVRVSPVESVTSSPLRTSNLDKRILAAGDTSEKNTSRKSGLSSMSSRKSLGKREGKPSVKMKERILYNLHPAQLGDCGNDSHHEEKLNKNNQENALSWQQSGKVTSLPVKEKDRRSGSEVSRDKMKVSASENVFSKNGVNYELADNPSYHASGTETRHDAKNSSPVSRHRSVDNFSEKNSLRHWSSEAGKQTEVKQDFEYSVPKVDAPCSTNRNIISHQNLIQNFEEENKANPLHTGTGSRNGTAKVLSSSEDKAKRETSYVGSITAPGSPKGDMSKGYPVHARNSADANRTVGVNRSSRNFAPDGQLSESGPISTNSSQTAFSILEEATKLKDSADHYKVT